MSQSTLQYWNRYFRVLTVLRMIVSRNSSLTTMSSVRMMTKASTVQKIVYIKERKHLYWAVCAGNLLALCVGFAFAWSSPVLLKLTDGDRLDENPIGRPITTEEASWIGSLMPCGGFFGVILAINTCSKCGRKISLLISCVIPFMIGFTLTASAREVHLFFAARFIIGMGVSSVYAIVPMYLSEIAEDEVRGFVCCLMMTFETAGELVTYCTLPFISICVSSIASLVVTGLVAIVILVWLPESPYYLLMKGRRAEAEACLMKIRDEPKEIVRTELDFMESIVQEFSGAQSSFLDLCKTKANRRAEVITLGLTVFQHMSGVFPVMIYSQNIFKDTGSSIQPEICTIVLAVLQFITSFIVPNFVDKLGRRVMLLLSAFGMLSAQLALGTYFYFKDNEDMSAFVGVPLGSYLLFLVSYLIGFGPLVWTIMGEVFSPSVKEKAFLVGVLVWWLISFTVSKSFYVVAEVVTLAGCFLTFAASCGLSIFFIRCCVIETNNKSFIEIQLLLSR